MHCISIYYLCIKLISKFYRKKSLSRQFLFVLPVAWGFSEAVIRSGMDKMWPVWLTFLIAEGISAVIALIFMRGIARKRIDPLAG